MPAPAVEAVDAGARSPSRVNGACGEGAEHDRCGRDVGFEAGLPGEGQRPRPDHDGADHVGHVIDDRHLVPDEVGGEKAPRTLRPRRAEARRTGCQLDDADAVEQRAHKQGKPGVQPGCPGRPKSREGTADRGREVLSAPGFARPSKNPHPDVRGEGGRYHQTRPSHDAEMVIYGVSFDMVGKQPIVLLKTADGNKFLPIWIGHPEAAAILMKLQGVHSPADDA